MTKETELMDKYREFESTTYKKQSSSSKHDKIQVKRKLLTLLRSLIDFSNRYLKNTNYDVYTMELS